MIKRSGLLTMAAMVVGLSMPAAADVVEAGSTQSLIVRQRVDPDARQITAQPLRGTAQRAPAAASNIPARTARQQAQIITVVREVPPVHPTRSDPTEARSLTRADGNADSQARRSDTSKEAESSQTVFVDTRGERAANDSTELADEQSANDANPGAAEASRVSYVFQDVGPASPNNSTQYVSHQDPSRSNGVFTSNHAGEPVSEAADRMFAAQAVSTPAVQAQQQPAASHYHHHHHHPVHHHHRPVVYHHPVHRVSYQPVTVVTHHTAIHSHGSYFIRQRSITCPPVYYHQPRVIHRRPAYVCYPVHRVHRPVR
ncbi:MAG: hypothetical protein JJU36_03400, partial [Phycisphaeraceae bacterium]|nr:hypothetical protein [Phycisphaeraceae bacterium]